MIDYRLSIHHLPVDRRTYLMTVDTVQFGLSVRSTLELSTGTVQ
jgi:hypothetical protein